MIIDSTITKLNHAGLRPATYFMITYIGRNPPHVDIRDRAGFDKARPILDKAAAMLGYKYGYAAQHPMIGN